MKLIANAAFRYASRELAAGEQFEASDSDAHVLKLTGKAKDAGDDSDARSPEPAQAGEAVAADGLFAGNQPTSRRGGRHNRRDMRAKE